MFVFPQIARNLFRPLFKAKLFSVTTILILGISIGINTAGFCLLETCILHPLPFRNPENLISVHLRGQNLDRALLSYPIFKDLKDSQKDIELGAAAWDMCDLIRKGQVPLRLQWHYCSASLFKISGLPFIMGHPFSEAEDRHNGPLQVVINEHTWRSVFDSDPAILGKSLLLNGYSFTVIGVCPTQVCYHGGEQSDFYVPAHVAELYLYSLQDRQQPIWRVYGRMKPGTNLAAADSAFNVLYTNLVVHYPEEAKFRIHTVPLAEGFTGQYAESIWLLSAANTCLYLISLVVLTGLLTVRLGQRRREIAIRLALGSTRLDIIKLLFNEMLSLALIGGGLGLICTAAGLHFIKLWAPGDLYRVEQLHLNFGVLIATLFLLLLAAVAVVLGPALFIVHTHPSVILKEEGEFTGSSAPRRKLVHVMLPGCMFALAAFLFISTRLLSVSFDRMRHVELGFDPKHILTACVYPTNAKKYGNFADVRLFFEKLNQQLQKIPDKQVSATNEMIPFAGYGPEPVQVVNQNLPDSRPKHLLMAQPSSPDYFRTIGIPLLKGRAFNEHDRMEAPHVCIVEQTFADDFFPGRDVIGQQIDEYTIYSGTQRWMVVGVVGNSRSGPPGKLTQKNYNVYFPYLQRLIGQQFVILRGRGDPMAMLPSLRRALSELDPDIPLTKIRSLESVIESNYTFQALVSHLFGLYSMVSLTLTVIGVYVLEANMVVQRRRDIAIRLALGSSRRALIESIFMREARLALFGGMLGALAAVVLFSFLQHLLYQTSAYEPLVLLSGMLVVVLAASAACVMPAIKAVSVDPLTILKE
jgi:predicted permease